MKLVHISDTHINPEPVLGSDPIENFTKCLAHIEANHLDADRVVITGDLTHHGLEGSFRTLKRMLEESKLRGDLTPRLVMGNHDNRDTYLAVFGAVERDDNGFIQWTEDSPEGVFVYMDTLEHDTHAGHHCEARRAWLASTLEAIRTDGKKALLFMHHNPILTHVAKADVLGLMQRAELREILKPNADIVRHIFFGHCHYTLSGSVVGIPFSAPRSTNHPCWPEFSGNPFIMGYGGMAQNYNVCFISDEDIVVHSQDFIDEENATWLTTREDGWIDEEVPEDTAAE